MADFPIHAQMIVNGARFTPKDLRHPRHNQSPSSASSFDHNKPTSLPGASEPCAAQRPGEKVVPPLIRPKSGIMSLDRIDIIASNDNQTTSSPGTKHVSFDNHSNNKPHKNNNNNIIIISDNFDDSDAENSFDETSIKETPPRAIRPLSLYGHGRHGSSEVRAFGEVMDEVERNGGAGSPTLRHVRGRIEGRGSEDGGSVGLGSVREDGRAWVKEGESFADAVKEVPPLTLAGRTDGGGEREAPKTPTKQGSRGMGMAIGKSAPSLPAEGESYADAVKEHGSAKKNEITPGTGVPVPAVLDTSPPTANGTPTQNGTGASAKTETATPKQPSTMPKINDEPIQVPTPADHSKQVSPPSAGESYASAVKDHTPANPKGIVPGNGVPIPSVLDTSASRDRETYEAVGADESPRSPVRKAHKRVSSRSLNGVAKKQSAQNLSNGAAQSPEPANGIDSMQNPATDVEAEVLSPKSQPIESGRSNTTGSDSKQNGDVVYEPLRNKSGENLVSIKPSDGFLVGLSAATSEHQDAGTAPPADEKAAEKFREEEKQQKQQQQNQQQKQQQKQRRNSLTSGRRAGAGWSRSAIRWAPLNVPIQRRLQTGMVLLHTLSIAGSLAIFFLLCTIPLLWPILLPYLLYVLLSRASIDGKLSQRSDRLRGLKVWSLFAGYFPARLHRSEPLEPGRKYIFGYHPHGIISHGAFAAFATEALGFKQLFPGITNTLLTLDSNFRIPLYRDYALRMGLASVSRESCENILSKGGPNGEGMGRAITIVIGGARESLDAKPHTLRLVLGRRKGFVKLAIRTGADLVPVLAFGENDIYEQVDVGEHPYVHKLQLLVKKGMGFTVPLFHARGKPLPLPSSLFQLTDVFYKASSTTT